jgi:hypothetical protein
LIHIQELLLMQKLGDLTLPFGKFDHRESEDRILLNAMFQHMKANMPKIYSNEHANANIPASRVWTGAWKATTIQGRRRSHGAQVEVTRPLPLKRWIYGVTR